MVITYYVCNQPMGFFFFLGEPFGSHKEAKIVQIMQGKTEILP